MKSEHRHELKTNDLGEWIANFPQWAQKNTGTIIYLSILAVIVIGLYVYRSYSKGTGSIQKQLELTRLVAQLPQNKMQVLQANAQGLDVSYMLLQTAENLHNFAQNTKEDRLAALALLKRAESLRAELYYRRDTVSGRDLAEQINSAKAAYQEAMDKSSSNPPLKAAAKFGLGLCEEELGNFEQAETIYSDIIAEPAFEATVTVVQAKRRLDTMADYKQNVVFKASAKPAMPQPVVVQPQIEMKAPDSNLKPLSPNNTSAVK